MYMGPVEFDDSKNRQWIHNSLKKKNDWADVYKEVNGEARRFFENESNEISSLDKKLLKGMYW